MSEELRRMDAGELRSLCVKHQWFTCGSNKQYNYLFEMNDLMASPEQLALIIRTCSDGKDGYTKIKSIIKDAMTPKKYTLELTERQFQALYSNTCEWNKYLREEGGDIYNFTDEDIESLRIVEDKMYHMFKEEQ